MKKIVHKYLALTFAALALATGFLSTFVGNATFDTGHMAGHVSKHILHRLEKLDAYAAELLFEPYGSEVWPELVGLPDDMVLYKYVRDTLHSWYNLFSVTNDDISTEAVYPCISGTGMSVTSPLAEASAEPSFVNLGTRWYLLKAYSEGNVKVIAGLLLKDNQDISRFVHIHWKYDIEPLSSDEGSPVVIDSKPLFKVVASGDSSSVNTGFVLRWVAVMLLICSLLAYVALRGSAASCLVAVSGIALTAFALRLWESRLSGYSQFFSPTLYAQNAVLDSFASLLIFNTAISLACMCVFWCRSAVTDKSLSSKRRAVVSLALLSAAAVAVFVYGTLTIAGLVRNSGIALELYRINSLSVYTLCVYLSYSFLFVSVILLCETVLCILNRVIGTSLTLLTHGHLLAAAVFLALVENVLVASVGFEKEENRVKGWGSRLAVDRDLSMEIQLRTVETAIATDPILSALMHSQGREALVFHRLEEMYLGNLFRRYDISVRVLDDLSEFLQGNEAISKSSPISPDSNFLYAFNPMSGSRYTGIFQYIEEGKVTGNLLVEITPRRNMNGAGLPPFYSYAKYYNNRLASFGGSCAYPTVQESLISGQNLSKTTFISGGYRHFVNRINAEETIVVSRTERGFMMYFVSLSFMALLVFLISELFRGRRSGREKRGRGFFSTRMRRLVVSSLTVTLVVMVSVSVYFVYRRNVFNLNGTMSTRISTIQMMLDGVCRNMTGGADMMDTDFISALQEISRNVSSPIAIYEPGGRLMLKSSRNNDDAYFMGTRLAPDAFRAIVFGHQRYFISSDGGYYRLYCPVFNSSGSIVAIAAAPYGERDYVFMRDAVFHAATVISLFLILLFITILLVSSFTSSIFRPLLEMSDKMKSGDAGRLEQIDYKGDDEVSAIVKAYNTMVTDLKESTSRLAVAERDKAWSEMARQVAHEIKNPLTPMKLEIQRIIRLKQRNDPSWEDKFDAVSAVVLEHIDILSQTAGEFSTFAKLYSEPSVEINLDRILKDQIMLFADKGVNITYLGMENALIQGPKPQLIRVFVNLLSNAVQATEGTDDPKVLVSLRKSAGEGTWDIVFEDNGPGVSEENQPKLFTPNFTTKSGGTGLGLAICRSIADRCGGKVSYSRSFTLGGACFTVTL